MKIKKAILFTFLAVTMIFYACTPKAISMFDYITPQFSGANGEGTVKMDPNEFLRFQEAVYKQYIPEKDLNVWKGHIKIWGQSDDMTIDSNVAARLDRVQEMMEEIEIFKFYEFVPKESPENLKNGDVVEIGIKKKEGTETKKINIKEETRTFVVEGLK